MGRFRKRTRTGRPPKPPGTVVAAAAAAIVLVAGVVSATTAGGGGGDDDQDGGGTELAEVAAEVAEIARSGGTARFELRQTPAGGQGPAVAASGVFELAGDRADFSYQVPRADGTTASVRTLADGSTFYLQVPDDRLPATEGRRWLSGEVAGDQGLTGSCPQVAFLEAFGRLGDDLEDAGREEVASVPTDHVRAEVPTGRLVEVLAPDCRPEVEGLSEVGVETVAIDEFVDDEGRPVLVRIEFAAGQTLTQVVELSDFGADLEVTPPPPEDTLAGGDLMAALQRLR